MKKILLVCLMTLSAVCLFGQEQQVDSLVNLLNKNNLASAELLDIYKKICAVYKDVNSDSLSKYALQGVSLAEKDKNEVLLIPFYRYAGISCFQKRKYDEAASYLDKALKLAIKLEDKYEEAGVYMATGYMYGSQSNSKLQIEYQLKALSSFEALGDKDKMMEALASIGDGYRRVEMNDLSIKYLNQAKDIMNESSNAFLKALIYYELGTVETELKRVIEYELKSIEFARLANNKVLENLANGSLVRVYMSGELKDYDKALAHEKECYRIAGEIGSKSYVYYSLATMADIYRKQENHKACEEVALEAWAMDSTNLSEARGLAYNIVNANIHLGNREKASAFLSKYETLTDQYTEKSYHEEMVEMESKYESEKKELRIASLEKEKQLYVLLGIAGGAFLLALIGVLFYRIRLKRQQIKQLEKEKQLIATQAVLDGETAERSKIARDLHDGLGGMLSVVKLNLNDMQNFSILEGQDVSRFGKAMGMLDESISELRRIAHHMMPESLIRFGLQVSLEEFCRAIPTAHFQYLGEDSRLDSRLEVMIYRCAYELINNAVKYAEASRINVQLLTDNGMVALNVQDDGKGFNPEKEASGSGLGNIRTRVSAYNGKMYIHSAPGEGTEVNIEIESV